MNWLKQRDFKQHDFKQWQRYGIMGLLALALSVASACGGGDDSEDEGSGSSATWQVNLRNATNIDLEPTLARATANTIQSIQEGEEDYDGYRVRGGESNSDSIRIDAGVTLTITMACTSNDEGVSIPFTIASIPELAIANPAITQSATADVNCGSSSDPSAVTLRHLTWQVNLTNNTSLLLNPVLAQTTANTIQSVTTGEGEDETAYAPYVLRTDLTADNPIELPISPGATLNITMICTAVGRTTIDFEITEIPEAAEASPTLTPAVPPAAAEGTRCGSNASAQPVTLRQFLWSVDLTNNTSLDLNPVLAQTTANTIQSVTLDGSPYTGYVFPANPAEDNPTTFLIEDGVTLNITMICTTAGQNLIGFEITAPEGAEVSPAVTPAAPAGTRCGTGTNTTQSVTLQQFLWSVNLTNSTSLDLNPMMAQNIADTIQSVTLDGTPYTGYVFPADPAEDNPTTFLIEDGATLNITMVCTTDDQDNLIDFEITVPEAAEASPAVTPAATPGTRCGTGINATSKSVTLEQFLWSVDLTNSTDIDLNPMMAQNIANTIQSVTNVGGPQDGEAYAPYVLRSDSNDDNPTTFLIEDGATLKITMVCTTDDQDNLIDFEITVPEAAEANPAVTEATTGQERCGSAISKSVTLEQSTWSVELTNLTNLTLNPELDQDTANTIQSVTLDGTPYASYVLRTDPADNNPTTILAITPGTTLTITMVCADSDNDFIIDSIPELADASPASTPAVAEAETGSCGSNPVPKTVTLEHRIWSVELHNDTSIDLAPTIDQDTANTIQSVTIAIGLSNAVYAPYVLRTNSADNNPTTITIGIGARLTINMVCTDPGGGTPTPFTITGGIDMLAAASPTATTTADCDGTPTTAAVSLVPQIWRVMLSNPHPTIDLTPALSTGAANSEINTAGAITRVQISRAGGPLEDYSSSYSVGDQSVIAEADSVLTITMRCTDAFIITGGVNFDPANPFTATADDPSTSGIDESKVIKVPLPATNCGGATTVHAPEIAPSLWTLVLDNTPENSGAPGAALTLTIHSATNTAIQTLKDGSDTDVLRTASTRTAGGQTLSEFTFTVAEDTNLTATLLCAVDRVPTFFEITTGFHNSAAASLHLNRPANCGAADTLTEVLKAPSWDVVLDNTSENTVDLAVAIHGETADAITAVSGANGSYDYGNADLVITAAADETTIITMLCQLNGRFEITGGASVSGENSSFNTAAPDNCGADNALSSKTVNITPLSWQVALHNLHYSATLPITVNTATADVITVVTGNDAADTDSDAATYVASPRTAAGELQPLTLTLRCKDSSDADTRFVITVGPHGVALATPSTHITIAPSVQANCGAPGTSPEVANLEHPRNPEAEPLVITALDTGTAESERTLTYTASYDGQAFVFSTGASVVPGLSAVVTDSDGEVARLDATNELGEGDYNFVLPFPITGATVESPKDYTIVVATTAVQGDVTVHVTPGRPMHGLEDLALSDGHSCQLILGAVSCVGIEQFTTNDDLGLMQPIVWDHDEDGSAVDNPDTGATAPVRLSGAVSIGAGPSHVCAVLAAGPVVCWGQQGDGRLGNNVAPGVTGLQPAAKVLEMVEGSPQPVMDAVKIAAGDRFNCAITRTKRVKCWGSAELDQTGQSRAVLPCENQERRQGCISPTSMVISERSIDAAEDITAGATHTCVLETGGRVLCWGRSQLGQLGHGADAASWNFPTEVFGLYEGVTAISAGAVHTCAIHDDPADPGNPNAVKCWGSATEGQLGRSSLDDSRPGNYVRGTTLCEPNTSNAHEDTPLQYLADCAPEPGFVLWDHDGDGSDVDDTTDLDPVNHLTAPVPLTQASAVSGGTSHTCAIVDPPGDPAQNVILCWGRVLSAGGSLVSGVGIDIAISGNEATYNCMFNDPEGATKDGLDDDAEDGDDSTNPLDCIPLPVQVDLDYANFQPTRLISSVVSEPGVCAFAGGSTGGGSLKCWGTGASGRLGNGLNGRESGTGVPFLTPVDIYDTSNWGAAITP